LEVTDIHDWTPGLTLGFLVPEIQVAHENINFFCKINSHLSLPQHKHVLTIKTAHKKGMNLSYWVKKIIAIFTQAQHTFVLVNA